MFYFREVTLKNGSSEKKRLIIEFDKPDMKIVGEFLMADAPLLHGKILQEIDQVLAGEKREIISNGNRSTLTIKSKTTVISDLFAGMENVDVYPAYEIDTIELRELIVTWFKKLEEFRQEK
ncbi:hypothetical protein KQI49_16780 [Virgibacillus sp. MSJ-26]|uniref:hypothetical protein n=1 Tax=Virgibacillus sp. MSJ-26 TaxID=2841522 RepID=UPI001C10AD0C|nr:hypothetical protein [Virgibacillus sp. MSJ-26]MBU5468480.1 hypothetical protein [Virgibacillus sp. MSJ-26]